MNCHFSESFGQAFSKACAVEAAKASSLSAESEIPLTAFSFASFSLAPPSCKRKAAKEFVFFKNLRVVSGMNPLKKGSLSITEAFWVYRSIPQDNQASDYNTLPTKQDDATEFPAPHFHIGRIAAVSFPNIPQPAFVSDPRPLSNP